MSKAKFPQNIKRGLVKIYRTPTKGFVNYTVAYYLNGKRHRQLFADLKKARKEANRVAAQIEKGQLKPLTLTDAERDSYLRARKIVFGLGIPLEIVAEQFAHAKKLLGPVSLSQAVEYYLRRHPTKIERKTVEETVDEFIKAKRSERLSDRYLQTLHHYLGKFKERFHCDIGAVNGPDIDRWLRELELSPRTQNNLRMTVHTLFNFAKTRRYLPKDHDEMDSVPVVKDRGGAIEVFTPAELEEILDSAGGALIPFLVLGAFAGIRHAEIQRLDCARCSN